jgi:hypothetical protein
MRHVALEASRGRRDKAHAIGEWVQSRIHYAREAGEQLEAPEYTLRMQAADCDGHAMLVAALLESIAVPWRFVYWTKAGEAHINTQARTGEGWINLETTEARPMGWAPGSSWRSYTIEAKAERMPFGKKQQQVIRNPGAAKVIRNPGAAKVIRNPGAAKQLPGAEKWWQFAQPGTEPGGVYCYNPSTGQFTDTPDGVCGCGELVTRGTIKPRPAEIEAAVRACAELDAEAPGYQVGDTPDRNPDADSLTCDACDLAGCAECFTCAPKPSIWIYVAIIAAGVGAGYLAARK